MDNKKDDKYYIDKVIENIDVIIEYTQDLDYEEFISYDILVDATLFRLIQMAENVKNISQEYKDKHDEIEWGLIAGFRNGIVHHYGQTEFETVYEIVSEDIYELRRALRGPEIEREPDDERGNDGPSL